MWKTQNDAMKISDEFGSKPAESAKESVSEGALALSEMHPEKRQGAAGPQRVPSETQRRGAVPASIAPYPANMAAYTEAVNEFTRSATAFIEQLPLLATARAAYDKAMKASAEMRKVLDSGDEDLRALMTQLVQAVSKPALEKKRPEMAKVETRGTEDLSGGKASSDV